MKLSFQPYTLQLRDTFTLSTSSRNSTPAVLVELVDSGMIGYGEASLPPYLAENQESVMQFLGKLSLEPFSIDTTPEELYNYLNTLSSADFAAKAAVDIAFHDLKGKQLGYPLYKEWGLNTDAIPCTSYTIGIDTEQEIIRKTEAAAPFKILKVKLGREGDKEIIRTIRKVTNKPLYVDVNQGWHEVTPALEMVHWCREQGVVLIEQPFPKSMPDKSRQLTAQSPLPIIADESFQTIDDLPFVKECFHGVNIKLMKCGGLTPAIKIIEAAKASGMKIMLGCMTETSCAISAASQLSPLADWADLDGHLLIGNNCFEGALLSEGKIIPSDGAGIGVRKLE